MSEPILPYVMQSRKLEDDRFLLFSTNNDYRLVDYVDSKATIESVLQQEKKDEKYLVIDQVGVRLLRDVHPRKPFSIGVKRSYNEVIHLPDQTKTEHEDEYICKAEKGSLTFTCLACCLNAVRSPPLSLHRRPSIREMSFIPSHQNNIFYRARTGANLATNFHSSSSISELCGGCYEHAFRVTLLDAGKVGFVHDCYCAQATRKTFGVVDVVKTDHIMDRWLYEIAAAKWHFYVGLRNTPVVPHTRWVGIDHIAKIMELYRAGLMVHNPDGLITPFCACIHTNEIAKEIRNMLQLYGKLSSFSCSTVLCYLFALQA